MSGLWAFHEHFLQVFYIVEIHFFLFLPDFTIFLHRKGLKPPLRRKQKKSEISIDRKESKLHANFSYRSNSLSPRGNKNLILARLGLELFFLSPLQVPPENWNFLSSYRGGRYQFESSCLSCPTSAPPKFIIFSLNKERGEEKRKKKSFSILWAVNGIVREEKELFSY